MFILYMLGIKNGVSFEKFLIVFIGFDSCFIFFYGYMRELKWLKLFYVNVRVLDMDCICDKVL